MNVFYKAHPRHYMQLRDSPLSSSGVAMHCRECGIALSDPAIMDDCQPPLVGVGPKAGEDVMIDENGEPEPFGLASAPRGVDGKAPGWKDDLEKNALHLIPTEAIDGLGHVLTFGARKYGDRNWEKGMAWSRCYGALLRHLNAWWGGEDEDAETGMPHLWHALCCLAFLTAYEARGAGTDDRPK